MGPGPTVQLHEGPQPHQGQRHQCAAGEGVSPEGAAAVFMGLVQVVVWRAGVVSGGAAGHIYAREEKEFLLPWLPTCLVDEPSTAVGVYTILRWLQCCGCHELS